MNYETIGFIKENKNKTDNAIYWQTIEMELPIIVSMNHKWTNFLVLYLLYFKIWFLKYSSRWSQIDIWPDCKTQVYFLICYQNTYRNFQSIYGYFCKFKFIFKTSSTIEEGCVRACVNKQVFLNWIIQKMEKLKSMFGN